MNIELTRPQFSFLQMPQKFRAYVGGFGSGKTWVGGCGLLSHHNSFPGINSAYYAPTYRVIKDVFYPTLEEIAFAFDWRVRIRISDNEVEIYRHGSFLGVILCRSMDKPGTIVGYKSGHSLVDELDTLAMEKARDAWRKIIARMRYKITGLMNRVDVTTTPEGFKFVYERFKKKVSDLYGLIQASTYENEINLNDDYIPSLYESYPEQLVEAYINGQFVNLRDMPVWAAYDEDLNNTVETVQGREPLILGIDFNVGRGCAVVYVVRPGEELHAVDEVVNSYDTPDTIRVLKDRYPDNPITVIPDASGKSRKSVNATASDLALLKESGYRVKVNKKNPAIKDRVIATNRQLCNGVGERRLFVNAMACPNLSDALNQQVYDDNGLPKKGENKFDDLTDSFSYPVAFLHPVKKPIAQRRGL